MHRQKIGAFGDDLGGAHRFGVILECHRKVRRVGHDHIGSRHSLADALHRKLTSHARSTLLDERIAFHAFHFFLDLLLGHAQVLVVLPALEGVIEYRQCNQEQCKLERQGVNQFARRGKERADIKLRQQHNLRQIVVNHPTCNGSNQCHLRQTHDKPYPCASIEKFLET